MFVFCVQVPLLKIAANYVGALTLFNTVADDWTQSVRELIGLESWLGSVATQPTGSSGQVRKSAPVVGVDMPSASMMRVHLLARTPSQQARLIKSSF